MAAEPTTPGLEVVSEKAGTPENYFGVGEFDDSRRPNLARCRDVECIRSGHGRRVMPAVVYGVYPAQTTGPKQPLSSVVRG